MRVPPRMRLAALGSAVTVVAGLIGSTPVLPATAVTTATVTPTSTPTASAAASSAASLTRNARTASSTTARTTAREAHRVDRVRTPKLAWTSCPGYTNHRLRCAWLTVPLDYDQPKSGTTKVRLLRYPAAGAHKLGTLFVNPGGPGGSATELAAYSADQFSATLRSRYDIVGMDPRGTNLSSQLHCFPSSSAQEHALAGATPGFPVTAAEELSTIAADRALAQACSGYGKRLAASMSTAEVARDMDVARRAVGSKKLNYLGFSYGTYLGEVYANLFPDRYRVLAIDGVVNPVAWAGTAKTRSTPLTARLGSAEASWKALSDLFRRCDLAGSTTCELAGGGSTAAAKFAELTRRLKQHPAVVQTSDGSTVTITYAVWISIVGSDLYRTSDIPYITSDAALLLSVTDPGTSARTLARRSRVAHLRSQPEARPGALGYDNDPEAYSGVQCTDGVEPSSASAWPAAAAKADASAPYFGRSWTWASAPCATDSWTAHDEDAYRGPFDRRVARPILVVGNTWDPATSYLAGAKAVDRLPNTRLLSSRSWGHTAYGSSSCVTGAVDRYLLTGRLPAAGKTCTGAFQPFGSKA